MTQCHVSNIYWESSNIILVIQNFLTCKISIYHHYCVVISPLILPCQCHNPPQEYDIHFVTNKTILTQSNNIKGLQYPSYKEHWHIKSATFDINWQQIHMSCYQKASYSHRNEAILTPSNLNEILTNPTHQRHYGNTAISMAKEQTFCYNWIKLQLCTTVRQHCQSGNITMLAISYWKNINKKLKRCYWGHQITGAGWSITARYTNWNFQRKKKHNKTKQHNVPTKALQILVTLTYRLRRFNKAKQTERIR